MPKGMTAIFSRTVGAGGLGAVQFANIPQNYTDLKVVVSARSSRTGFTVQNLFILPNTNTNNLGSWTRVTGNGSSSGSARAANTAFVPICLMPAGNASANSFSSIEIYIPNYATTLLKQYIIDGVGENNSSTADQFLVAGLFRFNAPITNLYFTDEAGFIAEGSTFTLYGISR